MKDEMKIITFEEKDARALLAKLKLDESQCVKNHPDQWELIGEIHGQFHYEVVKWLQDQGADCIRR